MFFLLHQFYGYVQYSKCLYGLGQGTVVLLYCKKHCTAQCFATLYTAVRKLYCSLCYSDKDQKLVKLPLVLVVLGFPNTYFKWNWTHPFVQLNDEAKQLRCLCNHMHCHSYTSKPEQEVANSLPVIMNNIALFLLMNNQPSEGNKVPKIPKA